MARTKKSTVLQKAAKELEGQGKVFLTADLHFFHDNIIKYCNRPWPNATEMNKELIQNWNRTVKKEDTIWILGDLALSGPPQRNSLEQVVKQLNGHKHFIYGNHDRLSPSEYSVMGIETMHYPVYQLGEKLYLCHDPVLVNCLPDDSILLCGHVHGMFKTFKADNNKLIVNIGVDVTSYYPISLEEIELIIKDIRNDKSN